MTTPDIAGLCERLRAYPANYPRPFNPDGHEAADTLERQAAEIERLRAGLTAAAVKLQLARGWLVEAGACRERVTATSRASNEARAALTGEDARGALSLPERSASPH